MSEKEKMLAGEGYNPFDSELTRLRERAHRLSQKYNTTYETDIQKRNLILEELLPNKGNNCFLQGPIQIDYGCFTYIGNNFYANFNFTILDSCPVSIGHNVFIGPNCTIATALHDMNPMKRRIQIASDGKCSDIEYGKPITIGNDCWIASNVMICAGVTIGDFCVIGAGSVVTRDIPPNSLAAGNPCKIIKKLID